MSKLQTTTMSAAKPSATESDSLPPPEGLRLLKADADTLSVELSSGNGCMVLFLCLFLALWTPVCALMLLDGLAQAALLPSQIKPPHLGAGFLTPFFFLGEIAVLRWTARLLWGRTTLSLTNLSRSVSFAKRSAAVVSAIR